MSYPNCPKCKYHRVVKCFQKLENGDWNEFDGSKCFHPNAKIDNKPDKSGGVPVGKICWSCRGNWL